MSTIIYEKIPGDLYATGTRSVSTFPSGLIRVDQIFVCNTSAAATHRATLAVGNNFPGDSAPALDGLKIFPEVQERRRDDGFTEFIVSAYGRMNSSGTILVFNKERQWGFQWLYLVKMCTLKYVVKTGEDLYKYPTITPSITWDNLLNDQAPTPATAYGQWLLRENQVRNFGAFYEVELTYESI